ncbi:winged helix DNA-binding domain-containing protein [Corynebacterium epidermidicanis]|uniref:Winged helix DNA-binding domain n=1 Tax=Corynebacterium epidermidicanis TaxID=1050174 RepID=A0A0G3GXK3_9CORY|nr:winged helix DNA-binding domain-containing protein [Corynebacterium epidermidicanis]AKK04248.1 Winged helix DNA-binding domain [Corynebacterium epidermidicanis]
MPASPIHTTDLQDEQLRELRARRLIAQALVPDRALADGQAVAQHMLAVQGQLYNSGLQALACRSLSSQAETEELVRAGQIVRTWSQRGTHHFLAAEDARWMMQLCSPRIEAAAAKRRPGLGLTEQMFDAARSALFEALREGPVARTEAYALFDAAGVDPTQQRGPHILRSLGSLGDIVQGPRRGSEDVFMLTENLPVVARELAGEEALAELGTRYFHSHGPATVKDLAWWSGLTIRDAKTVAKLARNTVAVELAGVEYRMGEWQLSVEWEALEAALALRLELPAFDEYLLGYGDRSAVCPADLVPIVGPTKNGMCRPFVVEQGVVVGAYG